MFRKDILSLAVLVTAFAPWGQTPAHAQKVLLTEIAVNHGPLPGQKWRASENFGVAPPRGTTALHWEVVGGDTNAVFSVAIDVRFGRDPTILTNLVSGSGSGYPPADATTLPDYAGRLYIGGVRGAGQPFRVRVYAIAPCGRQDPQPAPGTAPPAPEPQGQPTPGADGGPQLRWHYFKVTNPRSRDCFVTAIRAASAEEAKGIAQSQAANYTVTPISGEEYYDPDACRRK